MKHNNVRKNVSLLACLSLICAMLLACSGCGNKDKEALIGDWESTIDLTGMLNEQMEAGMGGDEEMMSYFNFSSFTMKLNLSFNDDDTYKLSVNEEELDKSFDELIESLRTGITKYLEDMIAQQGVDMTVDEFLQQMGMDLDTFMDQALNKDVILASMGDMASSGTFEAKDGVLYMTENGSTSLAEYALDNGKLTLSDKGADDSELKDFYPLVFTKK